VKVLLVAEGDHEHAGALARLVERLLGFPVEIDPKTVRDVPITAQIQGSKDKLKRKALSWLRHAQAEGHDAVVLVVDHDGYDDRHRQLTEAQDAFTTEFHLKRAFGVAVRTFDCWMISDEVALKLATGKVVNQFSDPEESAEAKQICRNLLKSSTLPDRSQGEFYADVAKNIRVDILENRCPTCFKPFAERVRNLTAG
jgi:hypothetical protein